MQLEQVKQKELDIPSSCRLRVCVHGPLEVWKRGPSGTWQLVDKDAWGKGRPVRSVFKRLLTAPGRRLSRASIQEDLWPDTDNFALAEKNVYNAINQIRRVIGKDLVKTCEMTYELANQSLLWIDLEACEALLKEAENRGYLSAEVLPLLEQALAYLERGELLEGESGIWVYGLRKKSEDMLKQCRLWLAQAYEAQGKLWQAGEQYRALLQTIPLDEEALQAWISMLSRQGKPQEALKCYQEMKTLAEAQGFPLSEGLEQIVASLRKQPPLALNSPIQPLESILLLKQYLGEQSMSYSRRQMLQGILASACTALTLAPYKFLPLEKSERLLVSVHSPSCLNEDALVDFSEITKRYWKLSANASFQLLNSLFGLFQDLTSIQIALQSPTISDRLYSLSSEVAQLLGKTLFDLRDYSLACSYYSFALKAALEAHNYDLWATSLGRMTLLLLSNNQPQQALAYIREAHDVPIRSLKICSWLTTVEAEAYSYLGASSDCRKALERAKDTSEAAFLEADTYATGFTRARLASYEGSCYLRLNQPESALPVLEQALTLIDPTAIRRLSRLLTYLSETHILLDHKQQAYAYAFQALDLTYQTQSLDILSHVRKLRDLFLVRGENSYTKDLNRRIEETETLIANVGGIS